jgi:heme o synthase
MLPRLKAYYYLTKPGIIYGNLLTAASGFFLASIAAGYVDTARLAATLAGTALIIGSGCVFNNYLDRNIDKKMERTKKRALVRGTIPPRVALAYGALLGLLGFGTLAAFTNRLAVLVGFVGLFFYVVVYAIAKRRSTLGTVIGSVSGATPPLAGYVAASNQLDAGAWLIFLILVCWQMPHFYAIALFRRDDYAAAGLPVLPVKKGASLTKLYIVLYILAFMGATALLSIYGYTGLTFAICMGLLGGVWLWKGLRGLSAPGSTEQWARRMFFFSLLVLLSVSILIPLGALLP